MAAPEDSFAHHPEQAAALAASLTALRHAFGPFTHHPEVQPFLAWLMGMARPRRYVSVGAGDCTGYFTLCDAARQLGLHAQAYAIDEWHDTAAYGEIVRRHDMAYAPWSCLMRMPWRDAVNHFSPGSIDLLYIQATHDSAARAIFDAWRTRLSDAAAVVVIAPGATAPEALQNVSLTPLEGVCLTLTGDSAPPALRQAVQSWHDPNTRAALQRWFKGLGERLAATQSTRRHINTLSHEIGLRDQRIIALENEQGELARAADSGTEAETGEALARERARLAELEAQISGILSSRSWRITRPLRALMQRLRSRLHSGTRGAPASGAEPVPSPEYLPPPENRNDYAEWVRRYDTLNDARRSEFEQATAHATTRLAVFVCGNKGGASAEPGAVLGRQSYPHVEARALPPTGPGWQEAVTAALNDSTADWILFADGSGHLADEALRRIVAHLQAHPDAQALYSDSDTNGAQGRHHPEFRGDWNPALFLAQDYWGPLRALRRDAVQRALQAPLSPHAPLADLTLRVTESVRSQQITHIARVLYHRHGAAAPAATADAPAIAHHAEIVQAHLTRKGINAKAAPGEHGVHVRYALPDPPPLATLIIPTRNGLSLMRQCIGSIQEKTTYPRYEIIIMDNGSDDPEALAWFEEIARTPNIRVVRDDSPFNYSALNNRAAALANGEILVLVNNDIEVISPDWLEEMIGHAVQPDVGAVGARLWYPNDTLQHGGVVLGIRGVAAHAHGPLARGEPGYLGRAHLTQNYSAVTAACLAVRKSLFDSVGGLNERDLTVAFNDIDFCLRLAAAGYRNVWTPHAELYHHESVSRGTEDNPQKRARFAAEVHYMKVRWGATLQHDPAYNPNLTLDDNDFTLAWPPRL